MRLNEWIDGGEHEGVTIFFHACKLGLEGIVSEAEGLALPIWPLARLAQDEEPGLRCGEAGGGGGLVEMKAAQPPSVTIRQIEFELEKAEHGMGMPYDAERVGQLRSMLREARKKKLSAGLKARWNQR